MDAQLKAKWVEALRSGKYTQARDKIGHQEQRHLCCLGVGADVANPGRHIVSTSDATHELERHGFPKSLDETGTFCGIALSLITMNDSGKKSFSEIADYIEANL